MTEEQKKEFIERLNDEQFSNVFSAPALTSYKEGWNTALQRVIVIVENFKTGGGD